MVALDQGRKGNGLCKICEIPSQGTLHVDHDHETGKIRGLLCGKCNPALGIFRESPEILERAAKYLRSSVII